MVRDELGKTDDMVVAAEVVMDDETLWVGYATVPVGEDILDAIEAQACLDTGAEEIRVFLRIEEAQTGMNLMPSIFWEEGGDA